MADGINLAKAYVQIVPSTQGIKGKLTSLLGDEVKGAGDSAGKGLGESLGNAVKKAIIGAGIGKVIQSALTEGADLQQSIGGVETLFKQNADTVKKYAAEAYKTAGLSANEYMEQVTSFSASLLQSLGGDTSKAAESANDAIIAMADNANKMGTDMSSIQNAYQGFAKQNYTMLDNLKLGYGGTKQEMERLLSDAEALSGVHYDIENLNDVYSAIHVIQDELGITGTTAKEASETFSGSLAAMKASVKNLLGSLTLGEDIRPALQEVFQSVNTFLFGNLFPMVGNALKSIPDMLSGVIGGMTGMLQEVASGGASEFVESGIEIVTAIIEGFTQQVPYLLEAFVEVVAAFGKALSEINWMDVVKTTLNHLRGALTEAAKEILGGSGGEMIRVMLRDVEYELFPAITRIQQALSSAFERIKAVFEPMLQQFSSYVASGRMAHDVTNVLVAAINTMAAAIEFAAGAIATIIEKAAEFVKWLQSGSASAEIFKTVVIAITAAVVAYKGVMLALTIAENAATIAQLALNAAMSLNPVGLVIAGIAALIAVIVILVKHFDEISAGMQKVWESVKAGVQKVYETVVGAFQRVVTFFHDIASAARSWGHDLIQNFVDGIQDRIQSFLDTIKGLAQSVHNFLGFSEPEQGPLSDFHTYAPDMMALFAKGIRDNARLVTDQIDDTFDIGARITDYAVQNRNANAYEPPVQNAVENKSPSNGSIIITAHYDTSDNQIVRDLAPRLEAYWARRGAAL